MKVLAALPVGPKGFVCDSLCTYAARYDATHVLNPGRTEPMETSRKMFSFSVLLEQESHGSLMREAFSTAC